MIGACSGTSACVSVFLFAGSARQSDGASGGGAKHGLVPPEAQRHFGTLCFLQRAECALQVDAANLIALLTEWSNLQVVRLRIIGPFEFSLEADKFFDVGGSLASETRPGGCSALTPRQLAASLRFKAVTSASAIFTSIRARFRSGMSSSAGTSMTSAK